MADTNAATTGWLDKLFNAGTSLYGSVNAADAANANARAAKRNADAAAAKSSALTKGLIIGGAVLAVVVTVAMVFRGR